MCVEGVVAPGPVGVALVDEDQPPQPSSNTIAAKLRIAALLVTEVARIICEVRLLEGTIQHCKPTGGVDIRLPQQSVLSGPDSAWERRKDLASGAWLLRRAMPSATDRDTHRQRAW